MTPESPASARESAAPAVSVLQRNGHTAYLVGGCVRDYLLGVAARDFDIATSAKPDQVIALFPGSNLVGVQFGVVIVSPHVEVATFRSDQNYEDGRRPSAVLYETDPRPDAQRRDFTINALFQDPLTDEIFDFVEGRLDLERGWIRAIGNAETRFREDHLRLLRAVRFAARLGFAIEENTFEALRKLAPFAAGVAPERTRDELSRILTEGHARRGMELLDQSGLLAVILPEIAAMKGVEQPPEFHPEGDVWTHTLIMLEGLPRPTPLALALGVLLHDVGKPATFRLAERIRFDGHVEAGVEIARRLLARLRYPGTLIEEVEALVANHMRFGAIQKMRESTLKRFLRLPDFSAHMELHRLDCLSSHRNLDNYHFASEKLKEVPREALKPEPLLRGTDLIRAGYQPGPLFSKILTELEDAQLEKVVSTPEDALHFVLARFPVLHSG